MSSTTVDIPTVDTDVNGWEFVQDPFALMEEWRKLGPVVYNSRHNQYMTFSYRNVSKVLGNVAQFKKDPEMLVKAFGGVTMESLNTPRHHDLRGVYAHDFQRDTLATEQRHVVARIVAEHVDPFVERLRAGETIDAVSEMNRHIPTMVIAAMLGIEPEMNDQFSAWSAAIGRTIEGLLEGDTPVGRQIVHESAAATSALNDYIAGSMGKRRAQNPRNDLVSKSVFHPYAAKYMEESEIVASNTQLVFAGTLTTAGMMGTTLVALAQHPEQRAALVADRSLIPQAFEEIHRWATLLQSTPRYADGDGVEVEGVAIPNGADMMPLLGAANRDPLRWENPERLDIFRPARQHLGFGFGMHVCLGLNLARLEIHTWLDRLLDLIPEYQLAGPIDFGASFAPRRPISVPLALK